ncbi:Lipoprotein-anchoring transpeptidase ErfK/SrfK [Altererythrobacter xiamenensis]|uniref:Lipoprotein-anchoring transpeptidase ErfK/SrfK n=1 Tax=Altererythrobacter xiamenensis TaxID=1316679 RepID=A0A1Y6FIV5_9SPHN|nr:L,D-transpeptidase [Altererythrobacter xiamenensis]SMQ74775.1 Lipoprotein-anchoring transpeptidase ErfK/SrfK [Altererythrobacter xiamenensis]
MRNLLLASIAASTVTLASCGDAPSAEADDTATTQTASQNDPSSAADGAANEQDFAANFTDRQGYDDEESASKAEASQKDGRLSLSLPENVTSSMLGDRSKKLIAVQVMLDKSRHSPGVIDGRMGGNTERAIEYYREAHSLPAGTAVDSELLASLMDNYGGDIFRSYTITEKDVSHQFYEIPEEFPAMAEMEKLGYRDAKEMLAERFHMDQDFLSALNPDADFSKAGTKLVIVSHGDNALDADIARIEVRKGESTVVGLDGAGGIVVSYPATIGSSDFPSPSGQMEVAAIAPAPNYTFDPEDQEWGPDKTFIIPPGPNNPVGGTWIDLGKDGYGIHGSPDPQMVAKRASHGCVRLTNWDAAAFAKAVKTGTPVEFV